jgi:hypothetical protein
MKTSTLALLAAVLILPGTVAAQVPGIELNFFPRIGRFKPTSELAEFSGSSAELRGSTAFGVSAELGLPLLPVNLRASLDFVPGTDAVLNDDAVFEGDNQLLIITGDLVFRLAPPLLPVQPYLLVGGGLKKYDFDNFATALVTFEDTKDLTGHLGAGISLKLGPIGVSAEVSDYVSWFKVEDGGSGSKMQNDLFTMVGVRIGMF